MHQIVFIDDAPYNLELAQAYLEVTSSLDLKVECFTHPDKAITACKQSAPDLIFLDLEMPEKDGFSTIGELRQFCRCPIVAMTGHSESSIKAELIAHKFNDYLGKPFTDSALMNVIHKYIPEIKSHADLAHSNGQPENDQGLNIQDMERRLRGNHKLIIRILDSFQTNNTHTFNAFINALNAEDWISAKRICHTLKGGGANIGAEALSSFSANLEKQCGSRERPNDTALNEFNGLIQTAIDHCRAYISKQQCTTKSKARYTERLTKLNDELSNDIAAAQDTLFSLENEFPEETLVRECVIAFNEFRTHDIQSMLSDALRKN